LIQIDFIWRVEARSLPLRHGQRRRYVHLQFPSSQWGVCARKILAGGQASDFRCGLTRRTQQPFDVGYCGGTRRTRLGWLLLALRVISLQSGAAVAFGGKRTSTNGQGPPIRSRMTQLGHRQPLKTCRLTS